MELIEIIKISIISLILLFTIIIFILIIKQGFLLKSYGDSNSSILAGVNNIKGR